MSWNKSTVGSPGQPWRNKALSLFLLCWYVAMVQHLGHSVYGLSRKEEGGNEAALGDSCWCVFGQNWNTRAPPATRQPTDRFLFSFLVSTMIGNKVQNDCWVCQPSEYNTLSIFINVSKTQGTIYFFQLNLFLIEV